jgi:hypothetical protein
MYTDVYICIHVAGLLRRARGPLIHSYTTPGDFTMPRSWLKAAGPVLVAAGLAPMAVAGGSLGIANATHNASAVVHTPAEATIIDLQHGLAASQTHGAHGLFQNVYLLAYLSGAASFWLTTGGFFYLQVVSDYFRPAWAPRGKHGIDSWRTAFRKAAWNLHVSLPSFVLFCAVVSFKAFEYCGIDAPSNVRWVGGTWAQMAGTMAVMAFVDDLVFWTAHWGLHASPYLFKNIHALHHRYHNPIAPAVFYTHPIDFIASYVRPGPAPQLLLSVAQSTSTSDP